MNVLTTNDNCVGIPIRKIKNTLYLIKYKYKNVKKLQFIMVRSTNLYIGVPHLPLNGNNIKHESGIASTNRIQGLRSRIEL